MQFGRKRYENLCSNIVCQIKFLKTGLHCLAVAGSPGFVSNVFIVGFSWRYFNLAGWGISAYPGISGVSPENRCDLSDVGLWRQSLDSLHQGGKQMPKVERNPPAATENHRQLAAASCVAGNGFELTAPPPIHIHVSMCSYSQKMLMIQFIPAILAEMSYYIGLSGMNTSSQSVGLNEIFHISPSILHLSCIYPTFILHWRSTYHLFPDPDVPPLGTTELASRSAASDFSAITCRISELLQLRAIRKWRIQIYMYIYIYICTSTYI